MNNDHSLNIVRGVLSRKYFEDDSSLKVLIDAVKERQIMEHLDRLVNLLKYSNDNSYNAIFEKLNIDDNTKCKRCPLLLSLELPLTPPVMLTFLYEIFK